MDRDLPRRRSGPLSAWARASNAGAVRNARLASVECSQRLVERAEVAAYLESGVVEAAARDRGRRGA